MARRYWASIGLALASDDSYAPWFREIMSHAGVSFTEVKSVDIDNLEDFDVFVLAGHSELTSVQQRAFSRWLDTGGRLIVCGSTWGLNDLLGVTEKSGPHYSRQYLSPPQKLDRLWPEDVGKTLFIGGAKVELGDAETVVRTASGEPAVTRKGRCIFIAPHVGQTLAMMYLGRSVASDAIGPGDSSVNLEDGVLRAEDGTNLSYQDDRELIDGCSSPVFGKAHADAIRQIFVRALYESLEECTKHAYVTWHWPDNAESVASASVDCDSGSGDDILCIYRTLANYGMPATWLVPVPGLPNDVYRLFRRWGHTPGLLHKLDSDHEPLDQLKIHHKQISRGAGSAGVPCVKIDDGQWFGLTDIYETCEQTGAKLSVGKGGVQSGSTGFLYGSCHMHFPIMPNGKHLEVAELPYIAYMPGLVTETVAIQHLVEEVARHYGCMHINLTQSHAKEQELGLQDALMLVRQSRMKQFSPEELVLYEHSRRNVMIRTSEDKVNFVSSRDIPGFTFMLFGGEHEAIVHGRKYSPVAVNRYGTLFTSFVMNLEQKKHLDLELSLHTQAA